MRVVLRAVITVLTLLAAFGLAPPQAHAAVEADLEVDAAATEEHAVAGESHQQSAVVSNHGPGAATSVVVEISASSGQQLSAPAASGYLCTANATRSVLTCRRAGLPSESVTQFTWTTTYTTTGDKTVQVAAFAAESDPDLEDNADVIVTAGARADLVVTAQDITGGPAVVGGTHTFSGIVTNQGPDKATGVVVTLTAGPGQRLLWGSAAGFSCTTNPSKSVVTCRRPTMDRGLGVSLFWSAEYTKPGGKQVTITVSSAVPDPAPGDNRVVVGTRGEESDLSVTIQDAGGEDPAQVGETRQQAAIVSNHGPDSSSGATITIRASPGQVLAPVSTGAVSCAANYAKTVITCQRTVPMSSGLGLSIYWSTTYTAAGQKTVTVEATGPNAEVDPSDNRLTILTRGAVSDVGVEATDLTGGHVVVGATHDQRASVGTNGPDDAVGVVVTITASRGQKLDPLPTGVASCTLNGASTVITCTRAAPVSPELTFHLYWKVTYTTRTTKSVTVRVTHPNEDPNPGNNVDRIDTFTQA